MEISTYILLVLGCLGGADIALFHSVAHGIRSHKDSVGELVTHSLRGPVYAALFLLIPNFAMQGLFAWGLLALFVIDVGISIWDFWLEQDSRRFLGGLPSGEYVLHMLMAIVFGALVMSFLGGAGHALNAPTRLIYAPAGPAVLRLVLSVVAVLVLGSGFQDAAAALRLRKICSGRANSEPAENPSAHQTGNRDLAKFRDAPESSMARVTWMRVALVSAGAYNLLWGAWTVLFPSAFFQWMGLASINYLPIWQCLGMIIGVYGIGYLVAAGNPLRHWPIVLVGLMGKIFGPAGVWWSVTRGALPARMAWVCVANDVIWWPAFTLILVHVYFGRRAHERGLQNVGDDVRSL